MRLRSFFLIMATVLLAFYIVAIACTAASASDRSHYYTTTTCPPTTTTTTVPKCRLQCPTPVCPTPVVNVPACPPYPAVVLPAPVCDCGSADLSAPCATIDDVKKLVNWMRLKKCRVTRKGIKCQDHIYLQGFVS